MTDSNEAILRRFLSLWATREPDAMAAMFATDGVYDNVPKRQPLEGRDAIRQWLGACFEHLVRIDVEIQHTAATGEWILCERLDVHVLQDRTMPLPVMNACRIVNGEIALFRDYYDAKTVEELLAQ